MAVEMILRCDSADCDETSGNYGWTDVRTLRRDMGVAGWAHIGRKDYCPACWEKPAARLHAMELRDRRERDRARRFSRGKGVGGSPYGYRHGR